MPVHDANVLTADFNAIAGEHERAVRITADRDHILVIELVMPAAQRRDVARAVTTAMGSMLEVMRVEVPRRPTPRKATAILIAFEYESPNPRRNRCGCPFPGFVIDDDRVALGAFDLLLG